MRVNECVAQFLSDNGISTVFGVMGDANMFYLDHFVRKGGGKYVAAAHEAGATLMALGYASVSRQIGVASVTQGPALANAVPALLEGVRARLPVVLMAGDISSSKTHLQRLEQRELVLATGAGFEHARNPESVIADMHAAFRRAHTERRPVVFNLPTEWQWRETAYARTLLKLRSRHGVVSDSQDLEDAVGIIAGAKRPIILAGRGATMPQARDAILALARRLGAPVMTTLMAKDLYYGEDCSIGVMGTVSSTEAIEALLVSDCLIAFGASLTSNTTSKESLVRGKRIVLVNDDPADLDNSQLVNAAVIGDSGSVAKRIMHWLDEAEIPSSRFSEEGVARTAMAAHRPKPFEIPVDGPTDARTVLRCINSIVPDDRVFVTDGGRALGEAWTHIHVTDPRLFVLGHNSGAIGLGMSQAIGAAVAEPNRPTVLVTGDGGFMMGGLTEFNTAVRNKLDLIIVMLNDCSYGSEHIQFRDRQMDPSLANFDWPDFAPVAQALGGMGVTVRSLKDTGRLVEVLKRRNRPVLIDVKMDPDRMPSPPW